MTTTEIKPPNKAYMQLIEEFPLRRINTEDENGKALTVLSKLMDKEDTLTLDEIEYMALLAEQISKFEKVAYPLADLKTTIGELVKILMKEHKITQVKLADELGVTQSNISHILNNKQKPTAEQVKRLAQIFHTPMSIFVSD